MVLMTATDEQPSLGQLVINTPRTSSWLSENSMNEHDILALHEPPESDTCGWQGAKTVIQDNKRPILHLKEAPANMFKFAA